MKLVIKYLAILFLVVFGVLTVFLTTSVLLNLFGIRAKEGNYVEFIVWINLFSGLLFLLTAFCFWKEKRATTPLLIGNSIILIVGIIGLFFHISNGGLYKMETVKGMLFRILTTAVLTVVSYYLIYQNPSE